ASAAVASSGVEAGQVDEWLQCELGEIGGERAGGVGMVELLPAQGVGGVGGSDVAGEGGGGGGGFGCTGDRVGSALLGLCGARFDLAYSDGKRPRNDLGPRDQREVACGQIVEAPPVSFGVHTRRLLRAWATRRWSGGCRGVRCGFRVRVGRRG